MIVTRAIRLLMYRWVESLHQRTRRKGNADRIPPGQGVIEDPIDKQAPGENADWARAWRSFQSWGPY